jgi:peptidoglycan/LPS O-acetylase OafA/YrhL
MFSVFLFGVLQIEFGKRQGSYPKIASYFAGFSYSLYVLHFPLLLFLRAWLVPSWRWQPDALHLIYSLIVGMVTLLFAWIVSVLTEKKTGVVRSWVDSVIPRFADARYAQQTAYASNEGGPLKTLGAARTDC